MTKRKGIWISRLKLGRFALAHRFPPTWRQGICFIATSREVFWCLLRCRTGHGRYGRCYIDSVPSEDPSSSCWQDIQTRSHMGFHSYRILDPAFIRSGPGQHSKSLADQAIDWSPPIRWSFVRLFARSLVYSFRFRSECSNSELDQSGLVRWLVGRVRSVSQVQGE